jgi:hypothetical protein
LAGSVSIAHIECPLSTPRRLTSGCLLEYGGAMKRTSPEISLENCAHGLSVWAGSRMAAALSCCASGPERLTTFRQTYEGQPWRLDLRGQGLDDPRGYVGG